MLLGHDNLIKVFKNLAETDNLFHSYIFFGEPNVGKATFARYLGNFLEFGKFEEPKTILNELMMIRPDFKKSDGSIGIDAVRGIKRFLYAKPVRSKRRLVVIDDGGDITPQAQNSILKIAEEPPKAGLIILIVSNPESLLNTLQSRFQKVYFKRASTDMIKEYCLKEMKLEIKKASQIAALSFGRIGRANTIATDRNWFSINKEVEKFLNSKASQSSIFRKLVDPENKDKLKLFLTELIANMSKDIDGNHLKLLPILKRLSLMSQFSVNKKLQLTAGLLWTT